MSFGNTKYTLSDLATRVDMFAKLSASLSNLVETGISNSENVRLCNACMGTMQELLDDLRGGSTFPTKTPAKSKFKTKK